MVLFTRPSLYLSGKLQRALSSSGFLVESLKDKDCYNPGRVFDTILDLGFNLIGNL